MKREEAIKLIDTHTVCFYNEIDSPTLQALHLAIEALQEPKIIVGIDTPYGSDTGIATVFKGKDDKLILEEVKEIMGWIPCSERLPDVGEIVIASWSDLWSDAIVFARRYCEDDWEWAYEQGSDYWESARVYDRESNPEAWMPLPEPYEPKTERRG